MKKLLILMAAALVVLAPTFAQTNNEDLKVARKEAADARKMAKVTALANAANEYAIIQGGNVRGRIVNTESSLSGQQIDNAG